MPSRPQMTPRNQCWGSQSRLDSFSKKTLWVGLFPMPRGRPHLLW